MSSSERNYPDFLEDKDLWVALGEDYEDEFIRYQEFDEVKITRNPEKDSNQYSYDMRISMPCDLKTIRTEWRLSEKLFGIDKKTAISINVKDVNRYNQLYPNIVIVLDVQLPSYKKVHWTELTTINRLIRTGLAKKHTYKNRVDDSKGNAKESYIFDVKWFAEMK